MLKPLYCCPEYMVSDQGYVLSKVKHTPLKPSTNHHGYQIINVMIEGKRVGLSVHQAVARTFLNDTYQNGLEINHKNGDKTDNSVSNLEWTTALENTHHAIQQLGHNKLSKNHPLAKAIAKCDKTSGIVIQQFDCMTDAARIIAKQHHITLNSAKLSIWRVLSQQRHSAYGYTWKYL